MAKTLVDIDPDLMERARRILGEDVSKKDAVTEGLRRIVAKDAFDKLVGRVSEMSDEDRELMLSWRK